MIVQVSRMSDGTRRITHISELTGAFSDVISMQDIFLFEKRGLARTEKSKEDLSRHQSFLSAWKDFLPPEFPYQQV